MRKIILIVLLLISIQIFGQDTSAYKYIPNTENALLNKVTLKSNLYGIAGSSIISKLVYLVTGNIDTSKFRLLANPNTAYLDRVVNKQNYNGQLPGTVSGELIYLMNEQVFINVKDYGAKGDGAANDSTAITSALQEAAKNNSTVIFPAGTYLTGKIIIPDSVTVTGYNATLKYIAGRTGVFIKSGIDCKVYNIKIDGGATSDFKSGAISTPGNRTGFFASNFNTLTFEGNTVTGFDSAGVVMGYNGYYEAYGGVIKNNFIKNCWMGIVCQGYAEYNKFEGNQIINTYWALDCYGGNNSFTGNTFNFSYLAILFRYNYSNHGHGIFANNQINHSTTYGLFVSGILLGFNITNNTFAYGGVYIINSSGMVVERNLFMGSGFSFYITGNSGLRFVNNTFVNNSVIGTLTYTSNTNSAVSGNYNYDGTSNSINQ